MRVDLGIQRIAAIAAVVITSFGLAELVNAQTFLLDLGNSSSFRGVDVPNPDSNGNYWNSVHSGAFYPAIIDSDGNASTVNFGFSAANGEDSFNGPAGVTSIPPTPVEIAATDIDAGALGALGGSNEAAMDFYVSSRIEILELDPSKTYDLTFFGSHKFNPVGNNTTRYTVYTDNTYTTPVASADLLVGVDNDHNRDTVATISGIAPQVSNILYIGFEGTGGGNGYLNAVQVVTVDIPEPCSAVLLMSAIGLAFGIRRR